MAFGLVYAVGVFSIGVGEDAVLVGDFVAFFVVMIVLFAVGLGFDSEDACGGDDDVVDVPGVFAVFVYAVVMEDFDVVCG